MPTIETIQGFRMAAIPSGSFMMGHDWRFDPSQPDSVNAYYPDEQPVHRVNVTGFLLGETPVTQKQYSRITGDNPSTFTGDDDLPVTNLGPLEIIQFCNRLSAEAGLDPCYDEKSRACDFAKNGFRMPTEAEWEYACRAGTTTHFYTGDTERDLDRAGWYLGNSGGKTRPVGKKEPNAWGLFDMHGNVFEFTNDDWNPAMAYGRYLTERDGEPVFNYYHQMNITRGGSWFSEPSVCRSAARSCFCSWAGLNQSFYTGFRLAKSIL